MKNARTYLAAVVLLAIIVAAIWVSVDVGLQASLIWTAIIGALAWAVKSSVEQKREFQRLLADKKRDQYHEFLNFLNSFLGSPDAPQQQPQKPKGSTAQTTSGKFSLEEFRKWSLRLTLIGSDEVVLAWNKARLGGSSGQEGNHAAVMRGWARLWLAMRRDCGHPDTQLSPADILASFVNDIEQYRDEIDAP